jgi:hypothetical protein
LTPFKFIFKLNGVFYLSAIFNVWVFKEKNAHEISKNVRVGSGQRWENNNIEVTLQRRLAADHAHLGVQRKEPHSGKLQV